MGSGTNGKAGAALPRWTALRDLAVVAALCLGAYLAASELDLAERLGRWIDRNEAVNADEVMVVLSVLAVGLVLFSCLRWAERRREAEARGALEHRYRQLVDRVPAITYVWNAGSLVGRDAADFVSPQITEILGVGVREWQSDPASWSSRVHPRDLDRVMSEWARTLERGEPFRAEYRMFARDGRLVWIRDEAVPVSDDGHGHAVLQGVMFDITDRKEVEEALRKAEAQYRDLVERIPTITYIEDVDSPRLTYVSPQVERILGFTPEEFMAPGTWRASVHPEDLERVLAADRRSDETGEDFDVEYRMLTKDGREVWVHEHAELIRDEEGNPRFWLGVEADVTERRLAEHRVRAAEQRYRRLVEHLPAVVYIDAADEDSTALYMSPRCEELLGYTTEEWFAQTDMWVRLLHPDDRDWVIAESLRTNRTGDPFICEYRLLAKDGRVVWVRDEAYLVETGEGEERIWQGVLLDISERKEVEETLRRREAVLPAVGFAAQRFLNDPDWRNSIDDVFARLGIAADVSRVSLYENTIADGDLLATRRFSWAPPEMSSGGADGPRAHTWSYAAAGCERWVEVMSAGGMVLGATEELPGTERRLAEAEGARAVLVVPVMVGGAWWGYLGFDECRSERSWSPLEIEALRAAADILGTAIHRDAAERRLAETEAQFRTLVEQLPAVTYVDTVTDPWRTTYVSPQLEAMVGYTQEEWKRVPSAWFDALHPDDRSRVTALVDEHTADGTPYEAEYRLVAKDGRIVWVRDQARIVPDPAGGETLSQGVMFDITSRVEAEQQLREAEERFRLMVEQSPAMLYIETPDPSAPSTYISPKVADIFGVSPEEYMSDPGTWERLVHPDDREAAKSAYEGALAAARPWLIEYRVVRPDGRVVWVRDESALTRDERGDIVHVQGVVHDITERKLAEQTLVDSERRERQAADRLRALDEMKNTFLAAVSHELRSPLTSILGLALTLERQDRIADDDREDLLARLAANARKLDRLLKDLLDIDRLSRGIVTPQYRLTDVGALVRRTVEALEAVRGRQVYVQTESVLIRVDPAKVERIIENLVANAARHTSSEARIWVSVGPKDGGALVVVEDDGPGVPDDIRSAIFEPFRQGPNVSKSSPGTGIGLSLVARFAELHGGRAWAEDREGGGASFGVFLPGSPEPGDRGGDTTQAAGAA